MSAEDRDIERVQRSTRTMFPILVPLHNKLRMKYSWYYKWHLWRYSKVVHTLVLFGYILALSSFGLFTYKATEPKQAQAANTTTWTVAGAGDASYNATYSYGGTDANGCDYWKSAGDLYLYWDGGGAYMLSDVLNDPMMNVHYYLMDNALPGSAAWNVNAGTAPAPSGVTAGGDSGNSYTGASAGNANANGTYVYDNQYYGELGSLTYPVYKNENNHYLWHTPANGGSWSVSATVGSIMPSYLWMNSDPISAPDAYDWEASGEVSPGVIIGEYSPPPTTIDISGTAKQYNESSNASDGETVKVAVNGVLQAQTGTTSGGSWTIAGVTIPSEGDTITVFIDGVADDNRANAVTKYDGSGDITGISLFEKHLSVGSADNQTLSNSEISAYDNSVSSDDDIIFDIDGSNNLTLPWDAMWPGPNHKLYVVASNAWRPASGGGTSSTVPNLVIPTGATVTLDSNQLHIMDGGDSLSISGTFNGNTSTVVFVAAASPANIPATDFYNLSLSGGTNVAAGNFSVLNVFTLDSAIFDASDKTINLVAIDTNTPFVINSGTFNANQSNFIYTGSSGKTINVTSEVYWNLTLDLPNANFVFSDWATVSSTFSTGSSPFTITFNSGSTYNFNTVDISTHGLITMVASGEANWIFNPSTVTEVSYVDVSKSTNVGVEFCATYSVDSGDNIDWDITESDSCDPVAISISGTAKQYDESTNVSDGETVKVAVNGVLQAQTGTTAAGAWTIAGITQPAEGDVVTVFVDGIADTNEANAVTKYDGTGDITGVELYEKHLTVGSADNQTVSNVDLSNYDYSVSSDEDIFFDIDNVTHDLTLPVPGTQTDSDQKFYVINSNTWRPDSTGALTSIVPKIFIADGATGTLDNNSLRITGSGQGVSRPLKVGTTGTFNMGTSTVVYESSETTDIAAIGFNNLVLDNSGTTFYGYSGGNFSVGAAFTIESGSIFDGSDRTVTLSGSTTPFVINGTFTPATGTIRYTGSGATNITSTTYNNLYLDHAGTTFTAAGDITVNEFFTVNTGTFDASDKLITLALDNVSPAFVLNGSFTPSTSTFKYTGGTAPVTSTTYYNLWTDSVTGAYPTGDITVSNVLTVDGQFLGQPSNNLNLAGNTGTPFVLNGAFTPNSSIVTYSGNNVAGNTTVVATTYYDLVLDNVAETFVPADSFGLEDVFTISNGTFDALDKTITLGSVWAATPFVVDGTFTPSTSTIKYTGGITVNIAPTTYYNLTLDALSQWIFTDSTTTTHTLTNLTGLSEMQFTASKTYSFDTVNIAGSSGNLITMKPAGGEEINWNFDPTTVTQVTYVDVDYSTNIGTSFCANYSTDGGHNVDWDISATEFCTGGPIDISGTAKQYDGTTNVSDGETVKVAVNGNLQAQTGTTSSGAWTISGVTRPETGDTITVFVDGVSDANEANAVTKYDGVSNISGINLYEKHLSVGSDENQVLSNADMEKYDHSVSGDEDIFFEVDAGTKDLSLPTVDTQTDADQKLIVKAGNTWRPSSSAAPTSTMPVLSIPATAAVNLDNTTLVLTGSGTPLIATGTLTIGTSTIKYQGSSATNVSSLTYYNLVAADYVGTTFTAAGNITATGTLTVDKGIFDTKSGSNYSVTIGSASAVGTYNQTGGTFNANSSTITSYGNYLVTGGTYNAGGSTLKFDATPGDLAWNTAGYTLNQVRFQSTSVGNTRNIVTATGTFSIAGSLKETTISNSEPVLLKADTNDTNFNITGDIYLHDSAFGINFGDGTWNINGGFRLPWNSELSHLNNSTVNFTGTGLIYSDSHSCSYTTNFYNVHFSGNYTIERMVYNNSLIVDSGKTLTSTYLFGACGSATTENNGTITGATGQVISFSDTSPEHISTSGVFDINVRFSQNTSKVVARRYNRNLQFFSHSCGMTPTWTLGTAAGQTFDVGGNITMINDSGCSPIVLDASVYNPTMNVGKNLSFNGVANKARQLKAGSGTWTLGGNIDLTNITLSAGSSTFVLNGSSGQSVKSALQSFNNLTIGNSSSDGTTFTDGSTILGTFTDTTPSSKITFNSSDTYGVGSLNITGSAGNLITLQSSGESNWILNSSSVLKVDYANIYRSSNAGVAFCATHSSDGGGNNNWSISSSDSCEQPHVCPVAPTCASDEELEETGTDSEGCTTWQCVKISTPTPSVPTPTVTPTETSQLSTCNLGNVTRVQIDPSEVVLNPGQIQTFGLVLLDAGGRAVSRDSIANFKMNPDNDGSYWQVDSGIGGLKKENKTVLQFSILGSTIAGSYPLGITFSACGGTLTASSSVTMIGGGGVVNDIRTIIGSVVLATREAASSPAAAPITAAVAAATLAALAVSSSFPAAVSVATYFVRAGEFFRYPAAFLGAGIRRPRWGVVYDSVTKRPLSHVRVQIITADGKVRETQFTNENGSFGFLVPAGKYKVTAMKKGFVFPSNIVPGASDGQYHDVYHGKEVNVETDQKKGTTRSSVNLSIPMDQTKMTAMDLAISSAALTVKRFLGYTRLPIMIVGTVLTAYLAWIKPGLLNYAFLAIYLALWVVEIRLMAKPKTFGIVRDSSGNPLGLAIVRALDTAGHVKATVISSDDGKFIINIKPGTYYFDATRLGYKPSRSEKISIKGLGDLGKIKLVLKKQ